MCILTVQTRFFNTIFFWTSLERHVYTNTCATRFVYKVFSLPAATVDRCTQWDRTTPTQRLASRPLSTARWSVIRTARRFAILWYCRPRKNSLLAKSALPSRYACCAQHVCECVSDWRRRVVVNNTNPLKNCLAGYTVPFLANCLRFWFAASQRNVVRLWRERL